MTPEIEAIKHIGNMVDGKMVCIENCPSVTHNTPDTEEKIVEEFADKVTKYGYNDEYGYYQDWKDGVIPILQEFRTALLASHTPYLKERVAEARKEERRNLSVWIRHDSQCATEFEAGDCDCGLVETLTPITNEDNLK